MSYKVLVVDDEAPVRELFGELLKKAKCDVTCVGAGEEALCVFSEHNFDVVLLDIKLVGMSGLDVLKKLREKKNDAVVVMMTGFGYDDGLIAKSKEYGCSGYIGKNMPISQIMSSFHMFVSAAKEKGKK
ncbi:MAG: response regulator [Candidatus Omnitrophota bacterium]